MKLAPVRFNQTGEDSATLPIVRSRIVLGMLILALIVLAGRAIYLQAFNNDFLQQQGELRHSRIVEQSVPRGSIRDRNGEILAISVPVRSIWIDPQRINMTQAQLSSLSGLLGMPRAVIQERANSNKKFVYLKRRLPPSLTTEIAQLGIKGLYFKPEYYRYYPTRELAAHILGFTDIDDNGQEGLELAWQDSLASEHGKRRVIKDRLGRVVDNVERIHSPKPGQDLTLSIDSKIQYLAYRELSRAVNAHRARAGSIVALDAQTGEILAMANYPAFNPNQRANINKDAMRNRVLVDEFEPGSTLKPFAVAVALETGRIRPDTLMETSAGVLKIGKAAIRDVRSKGDLTVAQVIQRSSNVGVARIAMLLPSQTLWEMFNRAGFGTETGLGFPGEVSGKLRDHRSWRPIEQVTMAYGHGISVNLMQLARAYTLFTAGGELKPITLLKRDKPVVGQKIISRETALAISNMLEMAVQPDGTGSRARIHGYRTAGKTGTAHKRLENQKGYAANRYLSSFVGYAPVSNPRVIIAVMIDEPNAGEHYGGSVAAPVFSRVMEETLRMLEVPFDQPWPNLVTSPPAASERQEG
ncbi:MAG: penicillin-binding protein 2 [Nitrosomonas sp.]|nr:penicillin-binding protein 2 [Nitrosomonas sp.]